MSINPFRSASWSAWDFIDNQGFSVTRSCPNRGHSGRCATFTADTTASPQPSRRNFLSVSIGEVLRKCFVALSPRRLGSKWLYGTCCQQKVTGSPQIKYNTATHKCWALSPGIYVPIGDLSLIIHVRYGGPIISLASDWTSNILHGYSLFWNLSRS
jgi:hypothetical protein